MPICIRSLAVLAVFIAGLAVAPAHAATDCVDVPGIRPEIARAVVDLGITVREAIIFADLEGGIAHALCLLGKKITTVVPDR